jgi:uroporphyrinogen-III decarboxylase
MWPKLNPAYSNRWGRSVSEWHKEFGTDPTEGINVVFKETRKKTGHEVITKGKDITIVYRTPYGEMQLVEKFDEASQSPHPVKHPVQTKEDIRMMTYWYEDAGVEFDKDAHERASARCAKTGETAYMISTVGKSPLQNFVEYLAGVEQAHYLLADYPDEVNELFAAMHKNLLQKVEIDAEHNPADTLNLSENTSTTLISPSQYETISYPQMREYCDTAKAAGKDLMIHMCGHLKLLLPLLAGLSASSFEAFTSPTVGNTTLLDGRSACPDICLMGGTNAYVWLWPADKIIKYLQEQLDALPNHRGIVVSSAGVMPPSCAPETIKAVKQWLDTYPVRV